MWRNVGITRRSQPLTEAGEIIRFWKRYVMDKIFSNSSAWQCQNMLTVSELIAHAAHKREESRGVHFRQDYPEPDDENFRKHFIIKKSEQ
jgi:L-aspartate oxidase